MNRTQRSDLIVSYQTHAGETGKNNEDRFTVLTYKGATGERGGITIGVIADGIGGNLAGEVASEIAIDSVTTTFDQAASKPYLDLFARAFAKTAQTIQRYIQNNADAEKMGTTCVAALIANRRLYTAYIGDSRMYLIRDGKMKQITVDHTWVQEAIEHGILTRAEARTHPNRHVVRRHLGAKVDATPDYRLQLDEKESAGESQRNQGLLLNPGDIILLSSDGLTDLVDDADILATFQNNQKLQDTVDALTLMARKNGGTDNITIIALQVPNYNAKPNDASARTLSSAIALVGLGIFSLVVLASAAVLAYYLFIATPVPPPTATSTATQPIPITFIPPTPELTTPRHTPTLVTPLPTFTWTPLPPTLTPTATPTPPPTTAP
ncbi:MAG: protein phosphatase 2C domain-containing protein [Chloroflexi bacterium]|nr:protein phosphatase 2C domain-containing protein [Chloroflexota bacterium]